MQIERLKLKKKAGSTSDPIEVSFPIRGYGQGYGFYYPPIHSKNDNLQPTLILHVHGGPTSAFSRTYNTELHIFCPEDLLMHRCNYRGSSGYGYDYQDALQHQWGIADVEDTISFAQIIDRKRISYSKTRLPLWVQALVGFTCLNSLGSNPGYFRQEFAAMALVIWLKTLAIPINSKSIIIDFLTGDLQ